MTNLTPIRTNQSFVLNSYRSKSKIYASSDSAIVYLDKGKIVYKSNNTNLRFTTPYTPTSLAILENEIYIGTYQGLYYFNVTDPVEPMQLNSIATLTLSTTNNQLVAISSTYVSIYESTELTNEYEINNYLYTAITPLGLASIDLESIRVYNVSTGDILNIIDHNFTQIKSLSSFGNTDVIVVGNQGSDSGVFKLSLSDESVILVNKGSNTNLVVFGETVVDLCPNGWHLDSYIISAFGEQLRAEPILQAVIDAIPSLANFEVLVGFSAGAESLNVPVGDNSAAFVNAYNIIDGVVDVGNGYFLTDIEKDIVSQIYFAEYGQVCNYTPPYVPSEYTLALVSDTGSGLTPIETLFVDAVIEQLGDTVIMSYQTIAEIPANTDMLLGIVKKSDSSLLTVTNNSFPQTFNDSGDAITFDSLLIESISTSASRPATSSATIVETRSITATGDSSALGNAIKIGETTEINFRFFNNRTILLYSNDANLSQYNQIENVFQFRISMVNPSVPIEPIIFSLTEPF